MNQSSAVPWIRFVRLSGEEGRHWAEEYHRGVPVMQLCQDAVAVLRRRQMAEGLALLRRAREGLDALDGATDPAVRSVVERWYYGALAYYQLRSEEFDEADGSMVRAHDTVVAALEHKRFLLPLAIDCFEFELHRGRIAQERRNWPQMRTHVETGVAMRMGERPLCKLGDGTAVWMADVQQFYRSLSGLSADEREAVADIVDEHRNRLYGEGTLRITFRLPGFVIQYP